MGNEPKVEPEIVRKKFTKRTMLLALSALLMVFGFTGFVIYFFTQNMIIGAPAVLLFIPGIILFKYYWEKPDDVYVQTIGETIDGTPNCLCMYNDGVRLEERRLEDKIKGYPWEILNIHKFVSVLITPGDYRQGTPNERFKPFTLPDQQFCDPEVFGQRVLALPAHRRMFKRKEKIGQTIKTILLVVTIIILWVVILTTTG